MDFRNLSIPYEVHREPICFSRRTCSHCEKRVELLRFEDTCPETYQCPCCKSLWVFIKELRIDAEDLYALSDEVRAAILNDESLLGIELAWD
jgi:hypothetical protein